MRPAGVDFRWPTLFAGIAVGACLVMGQMVIRATRPGEWWEEPQLPVLRTRTPFECF